MNEVVLAHHPYNPGAYWGPSKVPMTARDGRSRSPDSNPFHLPVVQHGRASQGTPG